MMNAPNLRPFGLRRSRSSLRQAGSSVLGLNFNGGQLEGVLLRRTNGSVEVKQTLSAALSLDLLTGEVDLVGREIRKQLDQAGIRERRCVVGLPLNWALTLTVPLPELEEADVESFLQIEAERGLPYSPDSLILAHSRFRTPDGEAHATVIGIPRDHVERLEAVLRAAQLKPVSFTLGICELQRPDEEGSQSTIALVPGETGVQVQISVGGGVAVLRTVEGAFELEGSRREFQPDQVAREVRITLGQLPAGIRESVSDSSLRLRVFGTSDTAAQIADQLRPRLRSLNIRTELAQTHPEAGLGVRVPPETPASAAFGMALSHLAGRGSRFEFLPPRVSAWQQAAEKYSSRKIFYAGAAAGIVVAVVLIAFLLQQMMLWHWKARWSDIETSVVELREIQANIRKYRPWFDDSFRSLTIFAQLTEAFPEDGAVTAKTVEIRSPDKVICSGTAQNNQALLQTLDKLRGVNEVGAVQVDQLKGDQPLQFTFNFQWQEGGAQ